MDEVAMEKRVFFRFVIIGALVTTACSGAEPSAETLPAAIAPIPVTWRQAISPKDMSWYKSDEAARIGENVLLYQADIGGWDKSDMVRVLSEEQRARLTANKARRCSLDNGATYSQLRFLANIYSITSEEKYKKAFLKGIDYLLAAQYPNGGWPQFYPLRGSYSNFITFNDGAMIGAMRTLDEVAHDRKPFNLGDETLRARCAEAVRKGVDCILKCQISVYGDKTVWCQQHDEVTYEPVGARAFEVPSLSSSESTGIVRFLMDIENPSPQVIEAVECAIKWLDKVKIVGMREDRVPDDAWRTGWNKVHIKDPNAEPMWARFYEIGTNKPIYVDRDSMPMYDIANIGYERRNGYAWTGQWPNLVLSRYEAWRKKWTPGRDVLSERQPKGHTDSVAKPPADGKMSSRSNERYFERMEGHMAKPGEVLVLKADAFKHYVDYFNGMEDENVVNLISNAQSWEWMKGNIPLFECPDPNFEQIYYYRWWTFRKHIKQTPDGMVVTEFLTPVSHAGAYNTISCAAGFHICESRWLRENKFLDEYILFWLRGNAGGPQKHLHKYSSWLQDALWEKYMVDGDREFIVGLLPDLIADYEAWVAEKALPDGLFWQYDVRDAMEESISGSRKEKNARPTISSYMYADARAIAKIARLAGKNDVAAEFDKKAEAIKAAVQSGLWDKDAEFFKVRLETTGKLSDAREEIGFIPWMFNLPDAGYEKAWLQAIDPEGFDAPKGFATAERRHRLFRSHGVGSCEWDGAVWPFATSQTLLGMANVLNNYEQDALTEQDYFRALMKYAKSHEWKGKPFIGEYLDEVTGYWLKGENERQRYYNHSSFADLVVTGLVGLRPRPDEIIEVNPLVPYDAWDWFCLDGVPYRGHRLTVVWDKKGEKYGKGKGLSVWVDGKEIARSERLERVTGPLR